MQYLKQSTAITLKIGPFLDETDGKTAETGLTIAQADVRLSKNGGDIAQKTEATSCTHDELGIYGCPIDATDTATLGRLQLFVHEAGALPVFCEFLVVTANVYDSLCSTDQLDVNVTNVAGTAQTGNDNGADINAILSDTNELQTDWVNGGRLDLLIDAIPTTAMRGTDSAALATGVQLSAQGKLDVNAEADTALVDMFTSSAQLVDDFWDEVLTSATHNVNYSGGKRMRDIGAYAITDGTAQAGATHSITLAAGASAVDGTYNRNLLVIVGGTGLGQSRTVVDYNGTSKVAVVSRDWKTNPDDTSEYQLTAFDTSLVVDNGVAQAGTNNTITLRAAASAINNTYVSCIITILAGTGRGQARLVNSYVGATKVVTVCNDWATNPDITSVYAMMPYGASRIGCMSPESLIQVNSEVDTCLSDYDSPTKTEMDTAHALLATEAKQDIIDTNVDSVLTDTGTTLDTLIKDIPTVAEFEARSDVAGTAATPAEVATALTDIHLDHLFAADYDPASKPGVATALLNEIIENDGGVSRYTSNALEQAPSGSGATAAEVRIEIDANSTKLASIETDTKGISDTACSADGASPTTNSLADIVRKMKWFVANLWEIDENATPDTFKIFKDDNVSVGLNFTVYTDSSKSYRDNTP